MFRGFNSSRSRFSDLPRLTKAQKLARYADTIALLEKENQEAKVSARFHHPAPADQFMAKLKPSSQTLSPLPSEFTGFVPQPSDLAAIKDETKNPTRHQALREAGMNVRVSRKHQYLKRQRQLKEPLNVQMSQKHNQLLAQKKKELSEEGKILAGNILIQPPRLPFDSIRKFLVTPEQRNNLFSRFQQPSTASSVANAGSPQQLSSRASFSSDFLEQNSESSAFHRQQMEAFKHYETNQQIGDLFKQFGL